MTTGSPSTNVVPQTTQDLHLLRTVATIIRQNGVQILRGESKLSLDTLSLGRLNHYFAVHYDGLGTSSTTGNRLSKAHVKDVEFLFQIIQKTPIMKLVHGTSTLQGAVDISKFHALTELEIKRVPVHLLSGLKSLRLQLKVLSCTRCINTLQEVFGSYRGDECISEPWPHLHTLDLSFNHLESLNELMESFPRLRSLDLSHNNIESVETFLQCLPKLLYLNIGYNRLKSIPNLGVQGKRSLVSLMVRNNNIDNLDGVEQLAGLEELEASHNCIYDAKWLEVLSQLHHIAMVNLQGNPVSYEIGFRLNLILSMSPKATSRCPIIDDKPISREEKKFVREKKSKRPQLKDHQASKYWAASIERSTEQGLDDYFSSINDDSLSSSLISTNRTDSRVRRTKIVRTPTIASQKQTKAKAVGDNLAEKTDFGAEINKMRQRHGPDWLIAVQNLKIETAAKNDIVTTKNTGNGDSCVLEDNIKEIEVVEDIGEDVFNRSALSEEGLELCGPFLVRVEGYKNEDLKDVFLTVQGNSLQEKDLDGQLIEELDPKALKSITLGNETMMDEKSLKHVIVLVVQLTFNYMRKDRQRRDYLMENDNDAQLLVDTLKPILEQNQRSAIRKDRMQCLKCSRDFNQLEAHKKVHRKRKDNSVLTNDIESVNEILVCPVCGSDLLVEVDTMHWEDQQLGVSTTSTPFGSITSFNNALPLASSSPWKQKEITDQSFYRSLDNSPAEFHTPSSSPVGSFMNSNPLSFSSTLTKTLSSNSTEDVLEKECAILERQLKEEVSSFTPSLPKQDLPDYPHDKMRQLLESNKNTKFDQRYCLVSPEILGSSSGSGKSSRANSVNGTLSNGHTSTKGHGWSSQNGQGYHVHSHSVRTNGSTRKSLFAADEVSVGQDSVDSDISVLTQHGSVGEWDDVVPLENTKDGLVKALTSGADKHTFSNGMNKSDTVRDCKTNTISGNTPYGSLIDNISTDGNYFSDFETDSPKVIHSEGPFVSSGFNESLESSTGLTPFGTPENTNTVNGLSNYMSGTDSQTSNGYSFSNSGQPSVVDDKQIDAASTPKNALCEQETDHLVVTTDDEEEESSVAMLDESFTTVDHRLKLYFSMTLFGDVEEFACMMKGPIYQRNKLIDFSGLLVISTATIFILKITNKESDNPSDWLFKKSQHPIKDLRYLHVGLGSQTIQFEFNSEVTVYTIQVQDRTRCEQFIDCILDVVRNCAVAKRFYGVSRDHDLMTKNLLDAIHSLHPGDSINKQSMLRAYILGCSKFYTKIKNVFKLVESFCSIVVTNNEICIVDENYFWPLNPSKSPVQPKMKQFTVKQLELISNVSGIVLYKDSACDISVGFFNEDSGEESYWHFRTETKSSLTSLINALEDPWERMFGVELQCSKHPSVLVQEDM